MEKVIRKADQPRFLNRELSWLEFNQRVLNEALDPDVPLLERVKFFAITSSNLDEFFEVRLAEVKQQMELGTAERSMDGMTPTELFRAMVKRIRRLVDQQYRCWRESLMPALASNGIRFLEMKDLSRQDMAWVERYYQNQIRPVLTPMGIDPAHPFPMVLNKSLNLIVRLEVAQKDGRERRLAIVQVPRNVPRLVRLPRADSRQDFVMLSAIIGHYLSDLFLGARILGWWHFRVTRNSELYIDEEDVGNLLKAVEDELHNRRKGDAVRLAVDRGCPVEIRAELLRHLRLTEDDLYTLHGPLNPVRLMSLLEGDHSPELRDAPFVAPVGAAVRDHHDLFAAIREKDILLHHPYESFNTVVQFLQQAARDPQVLAIKQTLYRTGGDLRIVGALMEAVRNGKQVTAVVELKARFDEANNIEWSRRLEESGVHVIYGLVGYKIHSKVTLVVRQEDDQIRRYLHLGTGNYNPNTAKIYTDLSLLTCRPDFGEDATNLFNLLTGICQYQPMRKFLVAPFELHPRIMELIRREIENARRGLPARIIAKMNALVDREVINLLYAASQAGVKIDLIVRGICCLRPGIPGLSENIQVRSIVDRFLEHSRIFYFENACQPEIFVGSADWMPRNVFCRIEVVFPIEDGVLRERIRNEILSVQLADNVKANLSLADGTYQRPVAARKEKKVRSQATFIEMALAAGEPKVSAAAKARFPRVKVRTKPA
jgi:polyphosphate kinase